MGPGGLSPLQTTFREVNVASKRHSDTKVSNRFDIVPGATYRGGMFVDRVRQMMRSVARHVDVMPDTLVIRAMNPGEPSELLRAQR